MSEKHRRDDREILRDVVGNAKGRQRTASDEELLADFNHLDELRGFESRSTMLPASLAACVPVFMATPTSAWASAGASLVPSPVMATRCPALALCG